MSKSLFYFGLGMLLFLAACGSPSSPTPASLPSPTAELVPSSAWGELTLLADAEDLNAPSLLPLTNGLFAVWTGSQENEARLFSRGITGTSQIMALKAYYPLEQRLFYGQDGRVLLLWLDRNADTVDMRLQAALLAENGLAEVGIISLSDLPTRRYSSLVNADETLSIVYSGGVGAVDNLYLQRIDKSARSYIQADLQADADFPALMADANGTWLFWLEANGQVAYVGRLGERDLTEIRRLGRINLSPEETVEDFRLAFDGDYVYLFWQIRTWDNRRYTLLSVGLPNGEFSPASRLEAAWLIPADSRTSAGLPIALNMGNQLGIAYLTGGTVGEFQPIVETGQLLGAPSLAVFPDGHLGLAWSSPSPNGYAHLWYTEEN